MNTPTAQTHRIAREGGQIAYTDIGTGPALLLIHGLGDTTRTWRHLTPRLVSAGYRVLELHVRGNGLSDATFEAYDAVAIAGDALAVLDAAHVDRATIAGVSMGGAVAAWMAAEWPERVERMIFLNAFVRDMPSDRWLKPVLGVLFADFWGAFMWKLYWKTLLPTAPSDLEEEAEWLRQHLRGPGRLKALRAQIQASKQPVADRLAEVKVDTLIIMGGADPDYTDPREEGRIQAQLLGGQSTVMVIDKVGHYPQVEATGAVLEAFASFIPRNGASRAA